MEFKVYIIIKYYERYDIKQCKWCFKEEKRWESIIITRRLLNIRLRTTKNNRGTSQRKSWGIWIEIPLKRKGKVRSRKKNERIREIILKETFGRAKRER